MARRLKSGGEPRAGCHNLRRFQRTGAGLRSLLARRESAGSACSPRMALNQTKWHRRSTSRVPPIGLRMATGSFAAAMTERVRDYSKFPLLEAPLFDLRAGSGETRYGRRMER